MCWRYNLTAKDKETVEVTQNRHNVDKQVSAGGLTVKVCMPPAASPWSPSWPCCCLPS